MEMQLVLLVVAEHLKHNGLALDVLNEGLCDLNWNLLSQTFKKGGVKMYQHRVVFIC